MFRPAALFIGLRYTRAKRKNHFISFISVVSMIGIALGITVLITVLSVMNGFDHEIQKRVFSMVPPIMVTSRTGSIADWQNLQRLVEKKPGVTASAPFVSGEIMLNYSNSTQAAMLIGILPSEQTKVSEVSEKMVAGKFIRLKARPVWYCAR